MEEEARPNRNLLAVGGVVTTLEGQVVEPPGGPLELPWLFQPTPERIRLAKKHLSHQPEIDPDTRWGWFVSSGDPDWEALECVARRDWRGAVKCWSGDSLRELHNRATLHRILYHSPEGGEKPEAHLRETLRLYSRLAQLKPGREFYQTVQGPLLGPLEKVIEQAYQEDDFKSVSRSLTVLLEVTGKKYAGRFQKTLLGSEFDDFLVLSATLQKELLPYQGTAEVPAMGRFLSLEAEVKDLTHRAQRLDHLLLEGSPPKAKMRRLTAQVCAILGQTYAKNQNEEKLKTWLREARRWDPEAVEEWSDYVPPQMAEEEAAVVTFPEREEEEESVQPRTWGHRLFGIRAFNLDWAREQSREEWLESFLLFGLPVFPLRRFAAYRNMDTGEVGYYRQIDLLTGDHLKQGIVVVLTTFTLILLGLRVLPKIFEPPPPTASEQTQTKNQIAEAVDRLKVLAKRERALKDDSSLAPEEKKARLQAVESERAGLISKIQKLEKQ